MTWRHAVLERGPIKKEEVCSHLNDTIMVWLELSVQVPSEYVEPISYLFSRYGYGLSTEDTGGESFLLRTYLPSTSRARRARIEVGVNLVRLLQPFSDLEVKELWDNDWESAWKSYFSLLKIGSGLVIKPSWITYEAGPGELVIELDPGMAFGTGYHPTTRMCLEALERRVRPGMNVLDLGTGSGILTIAAAKLGAASLLALDVDPTAVKAARKNFKSVGPLGKVRLARGTLPHRLTPHGSFDLATANITSKVLCDKAPQLHDVLVPGGVLIASGIIEGQKQELEETLLHSGFSLLETYQTDDWVALLLSKEA